MTTRGPEWDRAFGHYIAAALEDPEMIEDLTVQQLAERARGFADGWVASKESR